MYRADRQGQEFLSRIAEHPARLSVRVEDPVVLRVHEEDRVVRVLEDAAKTLFALTERIGGRVSRRRTTGTGLVVAHLAHTTSIGQSDWSGGGGRGPSMTRMFSRWMPYTPLWK